MGAFRQSDSFEPYPKTVGCGGSRPHNGTRGPTHERPHRKTVPRLLANQGYCKESGFSSDSFGPSGCSSLLFQKVAAHSRSLAKGGTHNRRGPNLTTQRRPGYTDRM